jgi:CoA:oxalate CoA-transferase
MANLFEGIRVLDLTKVFGGPFATRQLADLGAEVIKVECPGAGDDSRAYPPLRQGASGYFELLNRNKKGIALDLKQTKDREKFFALCRAADIVVENFLPSVKQRLQIDFTAVSKYKSDIIYASLSGIDQTEDRRYYDVIAQAESGLASLSGSPDTPMKIGPSVVDAFAGMKLAFALATALFYRLKTGQGQSIVVSMLGTAFDLLEQNLIEYSVTQNIPKRTGNQDTAIAPFGFFRTLDGMVALAAGNDKLWQRLSDFLRLHLVFDQTRFDSNQHRLENHAELTALIEQVFVRFAAKQLTALLRAQGIPCGMVNTMQDLDRQEDLFRRGLLCRIDHPVLGPCVMPTGGIRFSGQSRLPMRSAPQIGEHNDDYQV